MSVTGKSMRTKYWLTTHLGGLSLPRKSVVRLTDRPDMTLDVYRGRRFLGLFWKEKTLSYNQRNTVLSYKTKRIFDFFSVRLIFIHRMNTKSTIFMSGGATSENITFGVHG